MYLEGTKVHTNICRNVFFSCNISYNEGSESLCPLILSCLHIFPVEFKLSDWLYDFFFSLKPEGLHARVLFYHKPFDKTLPGRD